ncbi:DUF5906 domain-containing protein [uncultured Methanobacterium sp.]|uniref:DUF5906 domain-containing protein n=1 Tax=uncultured Methanobacterium sp. TaxID=176306 RepID=UPI002AA7C518|nr:DUF5906 domain-containing protein [uncultured Methanobacterium sp.]
MKQIKINKDIVFKHAQKVALSSKSQVKMGRIPKAPSINWDKQPVGYTGYNDEEYGTAIVCDYIDEFDKYLVVIDLDSPKDSEDIPITLFKEILQPLINITYSVSTQGKGIHIYLLSESKPIAKQPKINIDYQTHTGKKGRGKYIVSNYIYDTQGNKKRYSKLAESPDEIIVVKSADDVLNELLNKLEEGGHLKTPVKDYMVNITDIVKSGIRKGKRNDYVMCLAGYLRKNDFPLEKTLQIINESFKDDEELDHRFDTVKRTYEADISVINGWNELKNHLNGSDLSELERLVSGGLNLKDKILSTLSKNKEPSTKALADFVNSELVLYFDPNLRKYYERDQEGTIREIDDTRITEFLNAEFGENEISKGKRRNILGYVSKLINTNYNLIQFKNGILNTITREFNEDKRLNDEVPKLTLPFNWNEDAKSGRIGKLIDEILDSHRYPNNKELWLRAVGHAFMGTNRIGRMVIVQGESGTGKSTLTTILMRIFHDKYSEIKTQNIVKNERFTLYSLVNNSINIDDDISNGMLRGIGNLNTICTGNGLEVEIKGENKVIKATNPEIPRLFANGNTLPPVVGTGFERRLLLVHANNKVPYKNKDEYLQPDILSGKYDQDGIEWLVYHSINLYLDKEDEPLTSEQDERLMQEIYEFKAYPHKKGAEMIFIEKEDEFILKKEAHRYLKMWSKQAFKEGKISIEHRKPTQRQLNRAMKDAGYDDSRKMVNRESFHVYDDLTIKPEYLKLFKPSEETQATIYE